MSAHAGTTLVSLTFAPLSVPLREPFVIATGQMDSTRAVWVRVEVASADRRRTVCGWGEAAALPPVTWEDQPELMALMPAAARVLAGRQLSSTAALSDLLDAAFPTSRVGRAAVEAAVLDAWAQLADQPLAHWLAEHGPGGRLLPGDHEPAVTTSLMTDITLPIAEAEHMAFLARGYRERGFDCFKVKVGRDWQSDLRALRAVAAAVPDARFRLDANAGFSDADAWALLDTALSAGLALECFEQPCARADWRGMSRLTARSPIPIVADESFTGAEDLQRLSREHAATAVNLKLVKLGGPLTTLSLARQARHLGLRLMAGAMVETRLGLLAMAHVVAALGGVDWVDLDTAFLLVDEPFKGGWLTEGPKLTLIGAPGLGVRAVAG
jgi:L-alanine-DL-glutamate epimerase-like enolase superfamily enzyme